MYKRQVEGTEARHDDDDDYDDDDNDNNDDDDIDDDDDGYDDIDNAEFAPGIVQARSRTAMTTIVPHKHCKGLTIVRQGT